MKFTSGDFVFQYLFCFTWYCRMRVLQSVPVPNTDLVPSGPNADGSLQLVYPGTLWCGPGALTEDYNELGPLTATDSCCRQHDFCPHSIGPGESNYGLTNTAAYFKLHCDCDEKFLQCLKADSSPTSNLIRFIYFEVIRTECFREDYQIVKCASFKNTMTRRCLVYEMNTTAPKLYQFFDVAMLY